MAHYADKLCIISAVYDFYRERLLGQGQLLEGVLASKKND
jgi:hypothetical protein